jgi:hypothetical protein
MHARKAHDELWKLTSSPANLQTFIAATILLDGLDKDNEDIAAGERCNSTAREKIQRSRAWFEILCGVGEDGQWPEQQVRDSIRECLSVISDQIDSSAGSPASHFKRWQAVA